MTTPISAATMAYGNAAQLLQDSAKSEATSAMGGAAGGDFSSMLAESVQSVVDTGNRADQISMDMLDGKANVVDMVTAIAETELAV